MRPLSRLLDQLSQRPDCRFWPSTGLPQLPAGLELPADLAEFYQRYSAAWLFGDRSDPRYQFESPDQFRQIGVCISGHRTPVPLQQSWYGLAHVQDGNYIAIDCHPDRLGYCYDAFHESVHLLDHCQIIALSFTEFMNRVAASGDDAWWLHDTLEMYGCADRLATECRDKP